MLMPGNISVSLNEPSPSSDVEEEEDRSDETVDDSESEEILS